MSDNVHPSVLLKRLEQRARRRFGQNFLVQAGVQERIGALTGAGPGDRVLEVGPGLGGLTRALMKRGAAVTAVEVDRDLAAFLLEELPELTLHNQDATKVDWAEICPGDGWLACANLPYNVATPIVTRLVADAPRFRRLVLMFQREVAERLVAGPGTKKRGSLSVWCQVHADARIALRLPPGAFHPPPKVDSAVVVLDPHPPELGVPVDHFRTVVRAGFSQRRKTLENALSTQFPKATVREVVARLVGAGRRAETLTNDEWKALAREL